VGDAPTKVVLIEDSPSDALVVQATLAERAGAYQCVWRQSLETGLQAIRDTDPSVVLVDLGLPDSDGLETLAKVVQAAPDLAVIVLTGYDDDVTGDRAVRQGAQDYLVKGKVDGELLARALRYAFERKQGELARQRSEARFRALIQHSGDLILVSDPTGRITYASPAAAPVLGFEPGSLTGERFLHLVHPDDRTEVAAGLERTAAGRGVTSSLACRLRHADGGWRWIESVVTNVIHEPAVGGLVINGRDVTARRAIEEELQESKARLADLIDIAPEGIISIDETQTITLFNQGAEALFGYSTAEVLGSPIDVLLPEAVRGSHRSHIERFTGGPQRARRMGGGGGMFGRRKDGSNFPVEASVSKLTRGDRETCTVIVRDISERRAAEDALRDSERRLSAILDTLPVGVVVARAGGDVAYENAAARRLGGRDGPGAGAWAWADHIVEEASGSPPPEGGPIWWALDGHAGICGSLQIAGGAAPTPVRVLYAPIVNGEGAIEFGVAVVEDVTDDKEAQRKLSEQAELLARSNAELEQFAYVASHDLSEPLRTVGSFVQLLARRYEGRLDEDADEYIAFTVDGVRRMQTLIQDLLTYSRVSRLEYKLTEVDCGALVGQLAASMRGGEAVTCGPLPTVMADAGQLSRVFQNLIGNSLKFMPPDRDPHVEVTAERDGDDWRFTVKDNGIGIAPQHLDRIFKMFQRLHSQDEFSGTGIGLAVCQRVVERHGGRIWAESTEGEGSVFSFTLPAPPR